MSESTDIEEDNFLYNYYQRLEKQQIQFLQDWESNFQEPESEREKQIKREYGQFLTFKVHGAGAFGSVTEYYDLYRRQMFAKKYFAEIRDLKLEQEAYLRLEEVFGRDDLGKLIATISRLDVNDNTIFYESGVITLHDLCEKKMKSKSYWFEEEDELWYLIKELHRLIIEFSNKSCYHSDLKLVNTILQKDENENIFLKFIDIGAVTFDHSYVVAITEAYFPDMEQFDVTISKENRLLGELYQMGRMIQELCLTSIYSRQMEFYQISEEFPTYKMFKKYYFEHSQGKIKLSLELIKRYYSEDITKLIELCLGLKSGAIQEIENLLLSVNEGNKKFLEDFHDFVSIAAEEKTENYIQQVFSQGEITAERWKEELDFYLQFELDKQGLKKTQQYIGKYPGSILAAFKYKLLLYRENKIK